MTSPARTSSAARRLRIQTAAALTTSAATGIALTLLAGPVGVAAGAWMFVVLVMVSRYAFAEADRLDRQHHDDRTPTAPPPGRHGTAP